MKQFFLYLMALLYCAAGILHFIIPARYETLMPAWLPLHYAMIYTSGVAEISLGALLLSPVTRKAAAMLIITMLIVFLFLIHIPHTINLYGKPGNEFILNLIRTPFQFLLVWWAWIYISKPSVRSVK